ncbi:MaoC family dehydratase [Paracoccus lichenicola]|uniref:MaoC family dehydratase n=1 Tax=Paracoccus lichenicola TaxID=2665644 RepID=UPI0018AADEC9|nr:MaoC family dehydratase [Paracoccus lichenicola]
MDIDVLRRFRFDETRQGYSNKDTILYALGLGFGSDPLSRDELRFTYEEDLRAVPAMVNILAHPGLWVQRPELRLGWQKLLHAEQRFDILRPLPPAGEVIAKYRVTGVVDRGAAKGALLYLRKDLRDADGQPVARVSSTYMLRGDGGCGMFGAPEPELAPLPERAADHVLRQPTLPQQALLYRLSGDMNPLHASPELARQAGFDRPILHGLCTMGIACRALMAALCPGAPERLRHLSVRFSRPVYPGETIQTEIFALDAGEIRFRSRVVERDVVVLDRGRAELLPAVLAASNEMEVLR